MVRGCFRISLLSIAILGLGPAAAATRLAPDVPTAIGDMKVVCTGIGLEARQTAEWQSYPLKVEMAGPGGQFVGDVTVILSRGNEVLADVQCEGPWLLFRLPAGRYQLEADGEGKTVRSSALVPASGQARIILRFLQP